MTFAAADVLAIATQYDAFGVPAAWSPAPAAGEDVTVIYDRKTDTHDLSGNYGGRTRVDIHTVFVRASEVAAPAIGNTISIPSAGVVLKINQAPHHTDGGALEWRCPCVVA